MRRTARGLAYRAVRNRGTLGGSLAHADPVAEWPNVLTALNAVILLRSIDGMRSVPIREFLIGYLTTGLETGEIMVGVRSEEHTSELQSLMRRSYAVFCLKKTQKT